MKATELRGRTDEELRTNLREFEEELFNLRFQVVTGQVDNPVRARTLHRTIARIHTILRERELAES
ncbi:MAG: 50S ribosomal protein L29 [bacterium]|jgi:large subunit ribosomal protein L29|nr:50S ribosomal protein L29 [Nitrospinae bacterium AH_259_B05_G02_I21]MDV2494714.1 50S ribosomal protein L29 [bacterium]MDV2502642.1 50S ribosomal protein L29 [bacterium]